MPGRAFAAVLALAAVAGLAVALPAPPAGAEPTVLPSGFVLRDIETGLRPPDAGDAGDLITDFAYLPDESLLVIGKLGKVMWVPRTGAPRHLADIPALTTGDLGLIGLAVAPDYATSHAIYLAGTAPDSGPGSGAYGVLRLARWTVTTAQDGTPTGLADRQVLLETSSDSIVHGITGVVAAEDGTVWVTVGDSADFMTMDPLALRSLDLDDVHGKLLRLRPDGSGVPTNPYFDPAAPRAPRSLVYASGFRSPFRLSLDPGTGLPVLGDVGWGTHEEVDLVTPGNTYGWPCWEANESTPGYRELPGCTGRTTTSPMWSYVHGPQGTSVTGGVVYTGSAYPEEYRGRYFFGDYTSHRIWTMAFTGQGQLTTPPEPDGFGREVGLPVKFATVPSGGDIVFADIGSGRIRRLVYEPGNNPPVAVIRTEVDPATRTVTVDGSGSTDPNGDELTYQWDFGDGARSGGAESAHTYPAAPASFTLTLTVTDPLGATSTASATVYPANHAPELSVTEPDPGRTFAVGDVIAASATATDAEDGPLSVTWATTLVHCSGATSCHRHPGEQQQGGQFRMTFAGHPGDSHLEVTAIATDRTGARRTHTFSVRPRQRRITIDSSAPAGFVIGDEQTSSGLFTVGATLSVVAPEVALDGVAAFDAWGTGSRDRVLRLTVPDRDQTLSVNYLTPIDRRYAGDPALRDRLGAPRDVEQGDSTVRWREYLGGWLFWSPQTGAHLVAGEIGAAYLAAGGHIRYGLPTTDELPGADGGLYTLFTGDRSIYFYPGLGANPVSGAIYLRWNSLDSERSYLGYPTTGELGTPDGVGRASFFQRGAIYWTSATGAHEVQGAIYERWSSLGWQMSYLGYPTTGELDAGDGLGKANFFQRGAVYWTGATGAHEVQGSIYDTWASLGWQMSYLGYPTTGELATADGVGRASFFERGAVYWTGATGAHEVQGAILDRWAGLGWQSSYLGYPTTGELATADGVGRASFFQRGAVYWTGATGAHEVQGAIYSTWASLGWQTSYLGYPTSGEVSIPGGRRSYFQGGYIDWSQTTGRTTARRY